MRIAQRKAWFHAESQIPTEASLYFSACFELAFGDLSFSRWRLLSENTLFTIYPLQLKQERIGNLLLVRRNNPFSDDELVLAEVAAMITSVLMVGIGPDSSSTEGQLKAHVKIALDSLSYSELEAISNVFSELGGEEGFLVASKVADRIGITRSVIVNAMRKLESAGVVESRSLGMKGTYIKVKNPYFLEQLEKEPNNLQRFL